VILTLFSGEIEIRRARLKHHYKAQVTLGCENPLSKIEQHFEYIAVIDFEATCERNQGNSFPHEIIEFPIVLIHVPKRTIVRREMIELDRCFVVQVDRFQSYCRPTIRPILSSFCTQLTGIEQVSTPQVFITD
jgi:3'-5' exoribonuclease 1